MDILGYIFIAIAVIIGIAIEVMKAPEEGRSGLRVRLFRKRVRDKRRLAERRRKQEQKKKPGREARPGRPAPGPEVMEAIEILPPPVPTRKPAERTAPEHRRDPADLTAPEPAPVIPEPELIVPEPEPVVPEPPPRPPVEPEPVVETGPIALEEVAVALFASDLSGSERDRSFAERFEGRAVEGSGALQRVETYRSDSTFEGGPGVRAVLVAHTITGDSGGTREVRAIVQLPAEDEHLRAHRGETLSFRGRLVRFDGFLRDLYVADGRTGTGTTDPR